MELSIRPQNLPESSLFRRALQGFIVETSFGRSVKLQLLSKQDGKLMKDEGL